MSPLPFFILAGSPTPRAGNGERGNVQKDSPLCSFRQVTDALLSPLLVSLPVCSAGDEQALLSLLPEQHSWGRLRSKGEDLKTQYSPHSPSTLASHLQLLAWIWPPG